MTGRGLLRRGVGALLGSSLLAPTLLAAGLVLATPAPASAVATCAIAFNVYDANQTNNGDTTPGGTATALAYPGYTNGLTVYLDIKQGSTGCADSSFNKTAWYTLFSRWATGIIDGTYASQVDQVASATIESAGTFDYTNNFTGGFDLAAGGATTPTSGSTLTVYGDVTQCDISQTSGTTTGFSPDYYVYHTSATGSGAFYWLALGASNTGSKRRVDGGSWVQGGGGKGYCFNLVDPRRSDTIVYDTTIPSVDSVTVNGGSATNQATPTLALGATDNTALWLMAFSNSATCSASSTSATEWSPWETYAATKAWTITAGYGSAGSAEGPHSVCARVMDRAGNIDALKVTLSYDLTAPKVSSFTTALASPTNATSIPYTLVFNESVTGLDPADIGNSGTAAGCTPAVAGSGTTYTVTFTGCGTSGTLVPRLGALAVTDLAGNAGPLATYTGASLTLDRIPPAVTSFTRDAATDSGSSASDGITNVASPAFTLTFDESVTGLAAADFTLSGTAAGCTVNAPTGSGSAYRVVVSGCGEGTLGLTLGAGTVIDLATNPGPITPATASGAFTIDRTAPAGCTLVVDSGAAWTRTGSTRLTIGCTTVVPATDRMRFSNNAAAYAADEAYATSRADWSIVTGAGATGTEGQKTVTLQVVDLAGNIATAADGIGYDPTPPTLSVSDPAPGTARASNLTLYPVAYAASDATSGPPAVTIRRERVPVTGPTCPASGWTTDGATITATPGLLSGTLLSGYCYRWTLVAADFAGNSTTVLTGTVLTDLVPPVISSFVLGDGSGSTANLNLPVYLTASDALSGLAAARWSSTSGGEWLVPCLRSGLSYAANRSATLVLGAGAGDYAVRAEVCDAAGNSAFPEGVVSLVSPRRLPTLVLGASVVDCASPSAVLSTNTSGAIYWPVNRELCLIPTLVSATDGTDAVAGVTYRGETGPADGIDFTLLSGNPCPTGTSCEKLIGIYPADRVGERITYSTPLAGAALRFRIDDETTTAAHSLPAVSLIFRVRFSVRWYAGSTLSGTSSQTAVLELHVHSYETGVRPGP